MKQGNPGNRARWIGWGCLLLPLMVSAEQAIGVLQYRTGPYAALGAKIAGGLEDYLTLLNLRDGGVNGQPIKLLSCETGYQMDRVDVCARQLQARGATVLNVPSNGAMLMLEAWSQQQRMPLLITGGITTETGKRTSNAYQFALGPDAAAEAEAMWRNVTQAQSLRGKTVVDLYLDSDYSRSALPVLDGLARQAGVRLVHLPINPPGDEQQAVWTQIGQLKPVGMLLRGWDKMTPIALGKAAENGMPMSRIIGSSWSGLEEAVLPVAQQAKGYTSVSLVAEGQRFPVVDEIKRVVYAQGQGRMLQRQEIGSVAYNRGVMQGVILAEALRGGQARFGVQSLSGQQWAWSLAHLNVSAARLQTLGADGIMLPLQVRCQDRRGNTQLFLQRWDGRRWQPLPEKAGVAALSAPESASCHEGG